MTSPWTLRCAVGSDGSIDASELAGIVSMRLFDAGALAIGEETNNTIVTLLAGFDSEASADLAAASLRTHMPTVDCTVIEDVHHRDWIAAQRDGLEPTTIGPWTIRAPWHEVPDSDDDPHVIVIDPGPAFGHGAHPSTRLAIELMIRALRQPENADSTVVDLGSGTGVIAIIAARAGHDVRATEYDADAAEMARQNIETNGVQRQVSLACDDAGRSLVEASNLVIANVTIDVHRAISGNYSVADRIITSGLLCSQVATMAALLPNHRPATIRTYGEWAAISFERTMPPAPHDQR